MTRKYRPILPAGSSFHFEILRTVFSFRHLQWSFVFVCFHVMAWKFPGCTSTLLDIWKQSTAPISLVDEYDCNRVERDTFGLWNFQVSWIVLYRIFYIKIFYELFSHSSYSPSSRQPSVFRCPNNRWPAITAKLIIN